MSKEIELIGKVIIQEHIDTIDVHKIPRTFVLNVPDPYKSYYSRFTDIHKPVSIIFITKTLNSFEKILRVTQNINKTYDLHLDGAKCEVKMGSKKLHGLRLKGIDHYPDIPQIQQYFKEAGFEFAKSEKFKDKDSLIRVNRFFNLEALEKGLYVSKMEEHVYYVEVPKFMNWDTFRTLTFDIKNNVKDRNYDIAKGIFYTERGIVEMLRIVKPKASISFLRTIQQKYAEKLQQI